MEIRTCEGYVLTQLFEQQDENDRLLAELGELRRQLEEARDELADGERRANSPRAVCIRAAGREAIFGAATRRARYAAIKDYVHGEAVCRSYGRWCVDACDADELPAELSLLEFLLEFEPEMRRLYAQRLVEEGLGHEGGDGE